VRVMVDFPVPANAVQPGHAAVVAVAGPGHDGIKHTGACIGQAPRLVQRL
jgi:hypothetical protein